MKQKTIGLDGKEFWVEHGLNSTKMRLMPIQKNDLRDGVWIELKSLTTGSRIKCQYRISDWKYKDWCQGSYLINPIKLTKRHIKRLGFKQLGCSKFIINDGEEQLTQTIGGMWDYYREYYNTEREETQLIYIETIEYVHELQNLYYVLTKEEL